MRSLLAIACLLITAASVSPSSPAVVAGARSVEAPVAEPLALVSWRELADRPCRWLGRKVRVRMQYESELADWNAYMTRFGRGQFDALRGWTDEQLPWIEADYRAPEALFFVRKGTAAQHALADAKPYARFEFTVQVREVFLDTPWAEIVEVQPMRESIDEATVIHASRAVELMGQRAWRLAKLELDVALEAPLPDSALLELKRLRDICETAHESTAK